MNVTRFKQHTILVCSQTPSEIKEKFRKTVMSQSVASNRQKADFEASMNKRAKDAVVIQPTCVVTSKHSSQFTLSSVDVETDDDSPVVRQPVSGEDNSAQPIGSNKSDRPLRSVHNFMDSITPRQKNELDALWAKACFTNSWSFNSTNNPYLNEFIKKLRPSYKLPTVHCLSNQLLDDTFASVNDVEKEAVSQVPAMTLQLDGWTDINRASLVNVGLYAGRPVFLKSVDQGVRRHDAKFIANTVIETID